MLWCRVRREEVAACVATSWMVSKPGPNDCVFSREKSPVLSGRDHYPHFNIPCHLLGNVICIHAGIWHIFFSVLRRRRAETARPAEAPAPSASTFFRRLAFSTTAWLRRHPQLIALSEPTSPPLRLQRRCWMKIAWKEESPSRGLVGMETSVFVARGLLLCATEVSHCPVVREGLSRL